MGTVQTILQDHLKSQHQINHEDARMTSAASFKVVKKPVFGYVTESRITKIDRLPGGEIAAHTESIRPHMDQKKFKKLAFFVKLDITMKRIDQGALTDRSIYIKPVSK